MSSLTSYAGYALILRQCAHTFMGGLTSLEIIGAQVYETRGEVRQPDTRSAHLLFGSILRGNLQFPFLEDLRLANLSAPWALHSKRWPALPRLRRLTLNSVDFYRSVDVTQALCMGLLESASPPSNI